MSKNEPANAALAGGPCNFKRVSPCGSHQFTAATANNLHEPDNACCDDVELVVQRPLLMP